MRYFAAGKDRGVFVTLNKLTKLDAGENVVEEEANCDVSLCESTLSRYVGFSSCKKMKV